MPLDFLIKGTDAAEQRARLRELRCLAALILSWQHPVVGDLEQAIADPANVEAAMAVLAALPGKQRRRILASFGALHGMVRKQAAQRVMEFQKCARCGF
jgi:hypothetical protein